MYGYISLGGVVNISRMVFGGLLIAASSITVVNAVPSEKYQADASDVAKKLVTQLGSVMKEKMKAEGAVGAIDACSVDALRIANDLSRETGWQVKRVATKVRNPLMGMPDAWEQSVLAGFEQRHAQGESLKTMSYSKVIKESDGSYFRYMKAIPVKGQCLTCHGSTTEIPGAVRDMLTSRYPHDRAIGYKAGDLRGAISIKMLLPVQ